MKYRDIPWGVALGVLPGKVIGSVFIKPYLKRRPWKRTIMKWAKRTLITLVVVILILILCVAVDQLSGGVFIAWILSLLNNVKAVL